MDKIGSVANKAQYLMQEQMAAMQNSKAASNAQSVAQTSAQVKSPSQAQQVAQVQRNPAVQGQATVASSRQPEQNADAVRIANTPQQITDPAKGNNINLLA